MLYVCLFQYYGVDPAMAKVNLLNKVFDLFHSVQAYDVSRSYRAVYDYLYITGAGSYCESNTEGG